MNAKAQNLLRPGEGIRDTYEVDRLIGFGAYSEVYRVKHRFLGFQALKVMRPEAMVGRELSQLISEAAILSHLTHPNIVRVFEANSFVKDNRELVFVVMEYVSGESLHELLRRKPRMGISLALSIQRDICAGLSVAHQQNPPVIHRDIKPQNVMLSYDATTPSAKVSDFGLAKVVHPDTKMADSAGTIAYLAPEDFWGFHNAASDVYSAGLILYEMITGSHPWNYVYPTAEGNLRELETAVLKARKQKATLPSKTNAACGSALDEVVMKALEEDPHKRYSNATEFLNALIDYENRENSPNYRAVSESDVAKRQSHDSGRGFACVAGMDELKELLYSEIILPLQQKELYEKYRVSLPNGILFYGPPGCGKTFMAKKLAEEVEYHFHAVRPSDLASTYVHGTQEKIGRLFKDARQNAPTILLIDEIDALVPLRSDKLDHHYSSEVNEFLSQMSDCGRDGIVLIATTNRPERIDPAVLRTGRIDKLIYVPSPDEKARIALFRLFLQDRPIPEGLDFESLARVTKDYVASDIEAIVNDAARKALKEEGKIGMTHLLETIRTTQPSVSKEMIASYESFKTRRVLD